MLSRVAATIHSFFQTEFIPKELADQSKADTFTSLFFSVILKFKVAMFAPFMANFMAKENVLYGQ